MLLFYLSLSLLAAVASGKSFPPWTDGPIQRESCDYRKLHYCWNAMNLKDHSLVFHGPVLFQSCRKFWYFHSCLGSEMERNCDNAHLDVVMYTPFMKKDFHFVKNIKRTARATCELFRDRRTKACVERTIYNEQKMAPCLDSHNYAKLDEHRTSEEEENIEKHVCIADVLGNDCGPDVRAPFITLAANLGTVDFKRLSNW